LLVGMLALACALLPGVLPAIADLRSSLRKS
jgi:hypothetical protein